MFPWIKRRKNLGFSNARKKGYLDLKYIRKKYYHIQKTLDKRLKMRPIPKIRFLKQEKIENTEKVDEILEKIKKENLN